MVPPYTAYYNGMISAVKWKVNAATLTTANERNYNFSYDKLMRLESTIYSDRNGSAAWGNNGAFDESRSPMTQTEIYLPCSVTPK